MELVGLCDQQPRFVAPKPSHEPVVFFGCQAAGYEPTTTEIASAAIAARRLSRLPVMRIVGDVALATYFA
jgi:hypothetical protein